MKTKTNILLKTIVAAAMLGAIPMGLRAQEEEPFCPFGYEPGTGRAMTAEQRTEHISALQAKLQELSARHQAGTLTDEEQAWLDQVTRRGGLNRTGIPRGPRGGQDVRQGRHQGSREGVGPRGGAGYGRGQGYGPRDGSALGGGRGMGHGPRDGARAGGGQGFRHGLRDGTGPRAMDGTCPQGNGR